MKKHERQTVSVDEVSARLGIGKETLYPVLQQGMFPFCTAISPEQHGGQKWVYVIVRDRFEAYMRGADIGVSAGMSK